jgi:hypothetical protein
MIRPAIKNKLCLVGVESSQNERMVSMFGEDSYLDSSWEDRFESTFGYEDDDVNEGWEDDGWDEDDDIREDEEAVLDLDELEDEDEDEWEL